MAESSRDTTQLIRLVYASMCGGEWWGWSEMERGVVWRKKEKVNGFFSSFWKFFFFFWTDWMGTESYFKNLSWICCVFFDKSCCLMTASTSWQGTTGRALNIHYSLTFCPLHKSEFEIKVIWNCTHSKWPTGTIMLLLTSFLPQEESC